MTRAIDRYRARAGGVDEWTDVDEIWRVVEDDNRYDSGNFASAIREMEAVRVRKDNANLQIRFAGRPLTVRPRWRVPSPGWSPDRELRARRPAPRAESAGPRRG